MPAIEGLTALYNNFNVLIGRAKRERKTVIVGYTAAYALYVHENREIWPPGMRLAGLPRSGEVRRGSGFGNQRIVTTGHAAGEGKGFYWDPQGMAQPKFLEEPARTHAREIGDIVRAAYKRGAGLVYSLLIGGMHLQRLSQLLVPVDEGNLKGSAFTRLDERS